MPTNRFIENLLPISGAVRFCNLKLLLANFMQEDYGGEIFHRSEKSDLRDSASELYSGGGWFGRRSGYRYPLLGCHCFLSTLRQLAGW